MKFIASMFSVRKDRDGEVKLTLCIPLTQAVEVMGLEAETNYEVTIEEEK